MLAVMDVLEDQIKAIKEEKEALELQVESLDRRLKQLGG